MTFRLFALIAASLLAWSCTRHAANLPAGRRANHPSAVAAAMRRQTVNAVDAGDGDVRVRELRRKMAAEPGNLGVRMDLARHYEQAGYPELAVEHYRLAAARFPDDVRIQISLARALRGQELAGEAAAGLDRFLEGRKSNPGLSSAWSWLGILRDEQGELAAAERAHRAAANLRPDLDWLHNNLGYNLLLRGKNGEAAAEFRRALAIRPGSETARNNLGLAVASQPKEAILHWQSVSDPATAHNNLAAVLIEQGRYQEARLEIDIALGYKRDHPAALRNLRLVSELDGQPAAVRAARVAEPGWKRFARAVGRAVAGIETRQTNEGRPTASR